MLNVLISVDIIYKCIVVLQWYLCVCILEAEVNISRAWNMAGGRELNVETGGGCQ